MNPVSLITSHLQSHYKSLITCLGIDHDMRARGICFMHAIGGHINPAVTFALLLARKVTILRTVCYMIAQCAGAVCGVGMVRAVQGSTLFHEYGGGANYIHQGYSLGKGLVAEMVGTFLLVLTVMSATDPERKEAQDAHDDVPVSKFITIKTHQIKLQNQIPNIPLECTNCVP